MVKNTLGARDFSCAVSGFGQVFISDPPDEMELVTSRTPVGCFNPPLQIAYDFQVRSRTR